MDAPVAIIGGGPTGMTLALLLAKRQVRSIVLDARTLDEACKDARLLALSRGSLQTLATVVDLPPPSMAPIRQIVISSAGEFGRAVLGEQDVGGGEALGATLRYRDLLPPLAARIAACPSVEMRRPWSVRDVRQAPQRVEIVGQDGSVVTAALAVNAEGVGLAAAVPPARDYAVIADVEVEGLAAGAALERFTRDGPLALLPVAAARGVRTPTMALVWCMPAEAARRRAALNEASFIAELMDQLGSRNGRIIAARERNLYPLVERVRGNLREHRYVYVGNAAQALHPVAGQGLNLGLRDCVALADVIADALAAGRDPLDALPAYERVRRIDRQSIIALTKMAPALFATRFAPIALARSLALTALAAVPEFRREFARLMMFGVRL
jgi:2-octaprenyl-6-methoxyphenol hydroxylase